jgi:lysozyme family protein
VTIAARDAVIARVIKREGGVKDVGDGKGVTRWGQTLGWLSTFNLPIPETAAQAAENYAAWIAITGLDAVIGDTADPLADFVIDFAVNSSHIPAIKVLQRALRVKDDGTIGKLTRAAIDRADRFNLALGVLAAQGQYQGGLITDDPEEYARWARGWANRQAEKLLTLTR